MPNIPISRRRGLLLEAGVRVIARSGVAAATTRAIVAEAGMPLASFHYAFVSHEEFLLRLIERELTPALPAQPTTASFPRAIEDFLRGLLLQDGAPHNIALELAVHAIQREALRDETSRRMVAYDKQIAEALGELATAHQMTWSIPPAQLAPQVNAWRFGSAIQASYVRRGSSYATSDGAKEFSALLTCGASPMG